MKTAPLIIVVAAAIYAPFAAHASLLQENFEALPVGSLPPGWTAAGTPFSAQVVTGSSMGGESPNEHLLHLLRTETTGGYSYLQSGFTPQTSGQLALDFKLQINSRSSSDYAIMLGDASNNSRIYLRFHPNGSLSVYHGDSGSQLYTGKLIAENAWYQFHFEFDLDTEQFTFGFQRLDVSDSYQSAALDFRGAGATLNQFLIRSVNNGASSTNMAINWYMDDFSLRAIPEPGSMVLLAAGAAFALGYRRMRR